MIQSIIGTSFKGGFTTDFLIFGLKSTPTTPPDDYMLFNLQSNNTVTAFTTNGIFYGPTVFANNPNDGFKYFSSRDISGPTNSILFGKMDDFGNLTYLDIDILGSIGGAIDDFSFTSLAGLQSGTYIGLTGSGTSSGYAAIFDIIVSGGTVSSVSTNNTGDLYKSGDTITISADNFSGTSSQSITITVDSVNASSSPTSMHYLGNNQFVCLDRFLFLDNQNNFILPKTYMVDTFNQTTTLLSVHSVDDDYYPTSLFEYNGYTWGVCTGTGGFLSSIGRYDINAGVFNTELTNEVFINDIPGISMSKVWFIISAINVDGRIYCNLIVNDKETNNSLQCIGELNVETGEADYLYSVALAVEGGEYLYTNIINK
jgi:hypothetical protein